MSDAGWMLAAVELSRKGYPAPNPHVGCVIVSQGEIVGEGYHEAAGQPHAEAHALRMAGTAARGATAYVTLEPCNHHGRTPPCSQALIQAGVARVVFAVSDPNPKAQGGAEALREAGIVVEHLETEVWAEFPNRRWLKWMRTGKPWVTLKMAITLDGKAAHRDGQSKWITSEEAREEAHRLRALHGAVLVGRGTVQQDDPLLTARIPGVTNPPARVVLDRGGKLSGEEKVFNGDAPTLHLTDDLSLPEALRHVGMAVLVEGGPTLARQFLLEGLVDELVLFVAPKVFGEGQTWLPEGDPLPQSFELQETRMVGPDLMLTYTPQNQA